MSNSVYNMRALGVVVWENSVNVYNCGVLGLQTFYLRAKPTIKHVNRSIKKNITTCFYIGVILLALGTLFSVVPVVRDFFREYFYYIPPSFLFAGGVGIWITFFYWMNQLEKSSERSHHEVVLMDEPPQYETLSNIPPDFSKVPPPAYDQVCHTTEEYETLPQYNDRALSVLLCPVHHPSTDLHDTRPPSQEHGAGQERVDSESLPRSKSLDDLC